MSKEHKSKQDSKGKAKKAPKRKESQERKAQEVQKERRGLGLLQRVIGNQAVGRLVQRKGGEGGFKLDEETTARIEKQRGGGQALDSGVQEEVGNAMATDFSDVNVHTSAESDELNRELGAKAFTTGKDIFFREGEYDPHSASGKELITHELSHVVQQGSGQVRPDGSGDMSVNAPGDEFEREADAVAKSVTEGGGAEGAPGDAAQRQVEEEEEMLQAQEEEEEMLQAQEEEEEMLQARMAEGAELQRQELPEEEEVQMQDIPEEEEVQMQEIPEEEEVQMKASSRDEGPARP